ncbi:methyltransferase domain-containing protein [Methylosinus sp. PW1]|uniref:methyltransferase domain-containing protein n=1 Tax=Methylosinus sp. PW1 TaxID=107636 RepID=UPI000A69EEE2|nr:class I SAM-dependent methyltransferase [Methylosinus sp. PW1]
MTNIYDEQDYPYAVRHWTHPTQLGALSQLMGRPAAPFQDCRVLEIGAGDGVNLASMAIGAPRAQLIGVDLSERAVAAGRELTAAAGVANLQLVCADLRDFTAEPQSFDYIIAHGVYAWAPKIVQDAVMALCGRLLSPRGVAMISYNALPGCRLRQGLRDMLLCAVAGIAEPERKIAAARATASFYAEQWSASDNAFRKALALEARDFLGRPDGLIFHDELGEIYDPQLFSTVVAAARAHGLDYLCDNDPSLVGHALWESELWSQSLPLTGGDQIAYEQALDFVETRFFRRSLFCRAGAPLERRFAPKRLSGLYLEAPLEPFVDASVAAGEYAFKTAGKGEVSTRDEPFGAAMRRLGEAYPRALAIDEIAPEPAARSALLRLFAGNMARLATEPFPVGRNPGAKPFANPLARAQARLGLGSVTSYRHSQVALEGDDTRRFLDLLDGTRTVDDLARAMSGEAEESRTRAQVEAALATFAMWGLTRAPGA